MRRTLFGTVLYSALYTTPPDRPRPLESLCHGSSHKLFDYSFIKIHLIHLRRPRGKRTNERGAEDLLFVPLTLASPFACRSRVTFRDPSKGRSYSHANSRRLPRRLACVSSVSVWFRSKERPRNGILGEATRRHSSNWRVY